MPLDRQAARLVQAGSAKSPMGRCRSKNADKPMPLGRIAQESGARHPRLRSQSTRCLGVLLESIAAGQKPGLA